MKNKLLAILAVSLLAGPMTANAIPVTWEFRGEINLVDGSPGVSIGDWFSVLVSFDTDAALVTTRSGAAFAPGARYEYDASGVSFLLSLPGHPDQLITAGGFDLLWLRNNSGDRSSDGLPQADGLTFVLSDGLSYQLDLILRGSILDIFGGPGLPATPDPRLLDLEITAFQWSTSDDGFETSNRANGDITSINSVPEPGTLALLGLGLIGLGFARRRKNA